ncbi:class Ib ribonucleoside-diphosphate reductase assembly flavoprotein NrdI [Lacticigenium naphthae]|uniref:class Ib ribonucleoside-diphosphate reductase assembly flavoprotein NrdI n=1 Tax=Lacticigenium naphthae TaxID=515351 RepID=UPI00041180BA|nr:class Ib ribonucleoside-diphosphate reductase assembly flavoprotein NrdI [Lacticigenium naphthae]
MPAIVYFSITGQTKRFVTKIPNAEVIEIEPQDPFIEMDRTYILVVPTYVEEMIEPVLDFLETGKNSEYCLGTFGSGNRNFAQLFCFTVDEIDKKYGIPVLHKFEFQGTPADIKKIGEVLGNENRKDRSTV